jgi:methylenetetrahydrofolate dehydrogenase (NADP+)/methenyltetrahydrofolate cyclohydrolase
MSAKILDGKEVSSKIKEILRETIQKLAFQPKLVIIQVGENKESEVYITRKKKFAEEINAQVLHIKYSESVKETEIINEIEKLNRDKTVNGIIVQLPLPLSLNRTKIIDSIDKDKDVDGQTASNLKNLLENQKGFIPATTQGIQTLLFENGIEIKGKKVVVVGRSTLVGKPTALAFLNKDATVTICHSQTVDLKEETKRADILIIAMGKPKFINDEFVSTNQVVIDVGINSLNEKVVGDVDMESVKDIVKYISPVPGGVGPMTVASLFQNLVEAAS